MALDTTLLECKCSGFIYMEEIFKGIGRVFYIGGLILELVMDVCVWDNLNEASG